MASTPDQRVDPGEKPRIVMIGVGNLMEVIWPAIEPVVGGDDVAERLLGVTVDEADIDRKRTVFGFEILLGDNLGALQRSQPDIIMFSPPPTVAPQLIQEVLVPYVASCRADDRPLPDIYAYPPMPPGRVYHEALGDDVLVVNIIPNNVTSIAGVTVVDEGHYTCTFERPWPATRLARLQRIFGAQGAYVEIEPDQLIPMLGGLCVVSGLWKAVPIIADRLAADGGGPSDYQAVAAYLRPVAAFLSGTGGAERPEPSGVAAAHLPFLDGLIRAWHGGNVDYYAAVGIGDPAASTLVDKSFDLVLHTCQAEGRDVLDDHAVGAATKGGVLERAIDVIEADVLPIVTDGITGEPDERWQARLRAAVTETAHIVRRHGQTLAEG